MKRSFAIWTLVTLAMGIAAAWFHSTCQYALRSGWDSDIIRQWVVSRYIAARLDPWRLSLTTLENNFGKATDDNRARLRNIRLYEVHPDLDTRGIKGILPELGPPTAVFPPPGTIMLSLCIGAIPEKSVLAAWLSVNAVFTFLLLVLLVKYMINVLPQGDNIVVEISAVMASLLFLWPPLHEAFRQGQFSIVTTAILVGSLISMDRSPMWSGVLLGVALFKPSMILPFMIIPLIRKQWMSLAVASSIQVGGLLIAGLWVHESPVHLVLDWLHIAPYMFQGAYTVQELISGLGLGWSKAGTLMPVILLAAGWGWTWINRSARVEYHVVWLSLISVFWMYHERYDFIVLVLPWAILIAGFYGRRFIRRPHAVALSFCLGILGLALTDAVYYSGSQWAWTVRWAGRFALYAAIPLVAHMLFINRYNKHEINAYSCRNNLQLQDKQIPR